LKRWSRRRSGFVSVLFSEPKIPQSEAGRSPRRASASFSALQRAENSSIALLAIEELESATVSVLFSEPKIPQYCANCCRVRRRLVSVLFSEPKIPQFGLVFYPARPELVSVLFSEPKIPQSECP